MVREGQVIDAIDHILETMDRRGWDKLSEKSKKSYEALWALREGLEGNPDDGTKMIFYIP